MAPFWHYKFKSHPQLILHSTISSSSSPLSLTKHSPFPFPFPFPFLDFHLNMSTILHPCLESQFKETAKLVKLKVAAQPTKSMEFGRTSIEKNRGDELNQLKMKNLSSSNTNTTEHNGGWTFLQAISSTPKETMEKKENNSSIYIHPLSKYGYASSSSPRLSEKSLQICTENLGCETGSFWMDTNIMSLTTYNYSMEEENPAKKEQEQKQMVGEGYSSMKKVKLSRELPPPLTTMSGEKSLQVKTHREDGRLIIKAIEKPLKESCFLAERSEGRLKLCFLKDIFTKVVDMQQQMSSSPEGNEAEKETETDIKNENEMKMMNKVKDDDPGENEESSENQQENEEDYKEIIMSKEYVGNSNINDIDVENMGKEKFQRFGRCKECGNTKKKMCTNWEPLWVATS